MLLTMKHGKNVITYAVTTKISKSTFSHTCSKFLVNAKVDLSHYNSFRGGGSQFYLACKSVRKERTTDWQAQQTLVYISARQMWWDDWGTFWTWGDRNMKKKTQKKKKKKTMARRKQGFVYWLVGWLTSQQILVYLGDGYGQTIVRAAALR